MHRFSLTPLHCQLSLRPPRYSATGCDTSRVGDVLGALAGSPTIEANRGESERYSGPYVVVRTTSAADTLNALFMRSRMLHHLPLVLQRAGLLARSEPRQSVPTTMRVLANPARKSAAGPQLGGTHHLLRAGVRRYSVRSHSGSILKASMTSSTFTSSIAGNLQTALEALADFAGASSLNRLRLSRPTTFSPCGKMTRRRGSIARAERSRAPPLVA